MQNVILFLEPSDDAYNVSMKAGNSYFNRFGIDEDAGFELLGVYYLKKSFRKMSDDLNEDYGKYEAERKEKGIVKKQISGISRFSKGIQNLGKLICHGFVSGLFRLQIIDKCTDSFDWMILFFIIFKPSE